MFLAHKWVHNSKIYKTEYSSWKDARRRCGVKTDKDYQQYGGRGIQMCEQWLKDFDQFIYDMGFKPSQGLTLERIDVNGNYEPENCVWATRKEQARNKSTNRYIGEELFVDYAARLGVPKSTMHGRLKRTLTPRYDL